MTNQTTERLMHRLLYISTARKEMSEVELTALLDQSRRYNASVGITGALIVGGRRFLQVLEGDESRVESTFARIQTDPRHFATVILSRTPAVERLFGNWAMGYERTHPLPTGLDLSAQVAEIVGSIQDDNLRAYLEGFALQHAA